MPTRRNEETLSDRPWIYTNRNQVEQLWTRLKDWAAKQTEHAVATRYEKTARSSMSILWLAATCD